jgi:hypothetical protein
LKPLVGHCHLRLRCTISRNVSRSNAASPDTGLNLCKVAVLHRLAVHAQA